MKIERGHVLFAAAALCGAAAAQTTPDVRVPRPLEAMEDVKTEAPAIAKMPATPETTLAPIAAQAANLEAPTAGERPKVALSAPALTGLLWSPAQEGTLWALGETYKCAFSSEGATYIPYLGASAPRNHPLEFRLANVSRGGVPIPFEAEVAAVRSGERVSYDRGSFVEVYDLEPSSVEQSFVFERLPGEGDLVVRIAVQADLTPGEAPEGLEYRNDLGTVRYGRATVVDAAGKRASAPTRHAAGGIEIRVPAEFLADAALPLVVDPIVTTYPINVMGIDTYSPDVAYDATTSRTIAVYERAFSASDHDVFATVTDLSGNIVPAGLLIIDNSLEDWQNPKVANQNASGEFLVVSQVGAVGARGIVGQLVIAQTLFQGANFAISPVAGGEKINPTVGGDPSPTGPSYFCVVWERVFSPSDHDVHARLVDANGSLQGSPIMIDNTTGTLDQHPSISKSDGMPPAATQDWTVVWQRQYGANDEDLYGAQVHWDGVVTTPTFLIDNSLASTTLPSVSSLTDWGNGARRYLVVWQRFVNATDTRIGMSLRSGSILQASGDLSMLQNEIPLTDMTLPAVDTDGSTFALVYNELDGADMGDVLLANVCASGSTLALSERKVYLTYTLGSEMRPRIVAEHSSGGAGRGYLVVWDRMNAIEHDIEGARYAAPTGGPVWGMCDAFAGCPCGNNGTGTRGCGNSVNPAGGELAFTGSASLSSDTLVLNGTGMLPNSTCIYLQGSTTQSPAPFGDGQRCVAGTLIRLVTRHNSGGASSFPIAGDPPISVRGQLPAIGGVRSYQVWYRDPAANFCTATTYNITNAITAVWTP